MAVLSNESYPKSRLSVIPHHEWVAERLDKKYISELDGLSDFSLVCFGHDHSNHRITCRNKIFFNSGSVGCFNEPYARYGIIDIDDKGFYIKQQYIPYDFKSYVCELKKSSIPRKEIILGIYE